jgi:asparagine synthase (glutamine-hydrolysing)
MCGLAGIFSLTGRPVANALTRIERMTGALVHRGPDSQGVTLSDDGLLALGNTRLAIVDPEERTPQPLWTAARDAVISFNGEIYNHAEVRRALEAEGARFRTRMDTEVLLEGLRRRGERLLGDLDGMWAFAFYQPERKELMLCRDLVGERQLFYRVKDGELLFASEADTLIEADDAGLELDFHSAVTALRFHVAPPGRTLAKGLRRMRPGHLITATPDGRLEETRYRRLHPERWAEFFGRDPSEDEIIEVYEDVLKRASVARLADEVPFVATLSGGIDSTLVCALASEQGRRTIDTLFAQSDETPGRNPGEALDEYEASCLSARRLGTRHKHIRIDGGNALPILQRVAATAVDGLIDWGTASFEMLAHSVREAGAKVMLVSEGPDELLGGYKLDRLAAERDAWRRRGPAGYQACRLISRSRVARGILRRVLKRPDLVVSPFERRRPWRAYPNHQAFEPDFLARLLPLAPVLDTSDHYGTIDDAYGDMVEEMDPTQRRALAYACTSIPDYSNLRLDKGFMAQSVESRPPHLAVDVVELYLATPAHLRFRNGQTKHILRRIVERRLGAEISARSKHGFSAPIWKSPSIRDELGIEETIRGSALFEDFPFRRSAREFVLSQRSAKIRWPIFVLCTVYERLRNGGRAESVPPLRGLAATVGGV